MTHNCAAIMAGGTGTQLQPISCKFHPKQELPLVGERTLFQGTMDRIKGLISPDYVYVVTIPDQE